MNRICYTMQKQFKLILGILVIISTFVTIYADGLPGEYYVTQRWRDLFAGHSPATNPAFMTEENYFTTRAALSPTLQNTFTLMELGAIIPISLYQSLGVTYLGLNSSEDLEVSEWDPDGDSVSYTGKFVNDNQSLYILSYAFNPFGRLSIGANVNVYHKSNFDSTVLGASVDLALSYRFLRSPVLGDHIVGVNFQNLLSPDFGFQNWQNESANLKVSWIGRFWEKRLEAGIDLDIKDFASQAEDYVLESASGGAPKQIEFDFNFRAGVWLMSVMNLYVQVGSDYWGVCPGLNVPSVNGGRDLQVAYQYMSIIDDINLNSTHTFYFRGDFGKHREEIYARKMARAASVGPTSLYNKGRTLYAQGKYWEAFFIFGKILTEYPGFFKNDWVQLHLGLCQENLDMRESAGDNLNTTKKDFPRSTVVPYAELALLRIKYRDNNSLGVANQFAKLNTSTTPDSLKWHAYYYMGLQHLRNRKASKAIQHFSRIPEGHPEYIFAQFSTAIAHATNNRVNNSVDVLNNVIQLSPKNKEQKEIINRALTLVGYILYEGIGGVEQSLSQAVAALRKVPVSSYYYEDAQIGLAWTALKAQQWADCKLACDQIIKSSKKVPLQCEAMLLKGYASMVTKEFQAAVTILSEANNKISQVIPPSQSEKSAAKVEYTENRGVYATMAERMNDLAMTGQSSFIIKEIDSLHTPQMAMEKKVRGYQKYLDEFSRNSFFARPVEKLKSDLEYALAKAEKMAGEGKEIKIKDSAGEEIDKIEDQIEKYKDELEKLEGSKKK